jgi:hypothetical protein
MGYQSVERVLSAKNCMFVFEVEVQGGSNVTGTNCDLFTHKSVPVIFEAPCI